MKKGYVIPVVTGEVFEANEYVAVCFGLPCQINPDSNGVDKAATGKWNADAYGNDCHNHAGSCRNELNNRIIESGSGFIVQENNSEQGWITGGIDNYVDNDGNGKISAGDLVYWHTFSGDKGRRWNHQGIATNVDANHPNHS